VENRCVPPGLNPPTLRIRFAAEAQRLFSVETSTNLADWFPLSHASNLSTAPRTLTLTQTVDVAESARFFRLLAQ